MEVMVLGLGGNFKGCCAALVECMCVQGSLSLYGSQGSIPDWSTRDVNTQYGRDIYVACMLRMGFYIF